MMKWVGSFFADVSRVFMPPFRGLPFILWCYFVFSYVALPHNPIWLGDLPDSDDYTYLSQTLDWLQGQGWFDNVQHRMNPPEGVPIHYTRFAELPIAGMILLFRLFHFSWRGAALLGSFVLPVAYLGGLFAALRWTASRLMNPDWARLTSFVVMFGGISMFKFAPGQVDHHGLEAILTILAIGCAARLFARPEQTCWAMGTGVILALSTAIALEVLPWMMLISAVIALWTIMQGAKAARATESFGISLFLTSLVLLILDKSPAQIMQPDLLSYSIAYVVLAAGIAVVLAVTARLSCLRNMPLRFALSGLMAIAIGGLYLWHYPALLMGPYGAMDKKLADLFFANLEEAEPLTARYSFYRGLLLMMPPLMGLIASLFFWRKARDEKKWNWFLFSVFLGAAIVLTVFYQIRVLIYALIFAAIPLAAWVESGWMWIDAHYQGRQRFWAEIGLILLVGPLTTIFIPALQDGRSFNSGVLLFPAETFNDSCELREVEGVLNTPPYGGRNLHIMNMIDDGADLLFRTVGTVTAAPYHTNVRGNLDALEFFSTTDAEQAREIAKRNDINIVVMCRNVPDMYLRGSGAHYVVSPNGEVKMRPDPSLAGQLMFGHIPDWLTLLPVPAPSNFLLFEVKS